MRAARRTATALLQAMALALGAATVPAGASAEEPPPEFYGVVSQAGLADEDFARMRANGISLMRLQLSWKKVQPEERDCDPESLPVPPGFPLADSCDWSYYDRIVGGAAAAGVELMPYLLNVPKFVSEHENEPPVRSAADRQAWSEWVQGAVGRYGPGGTFWEQEYPSRHPGAAPLPVRRWQVWNEPSDGTYWPPRPNPAEYGDLVELTAAAIRAVDPGAEVILAGLFGTPNPANGGIRVKRFLRQLLRGRDLGAHFDSFALHPYGPNLRRSKQQVRKARTVLRRTGLIDRPLWITELGWASGGSHSQLSKTPRGQARLVERAYRLYEGRRERWRIAGVTWFAWQDTSDGGACAFCAEAGLVTLDRSAKPALRAYRRAALGG
jgi:hypothetical protein